MNLAFICTFTHHKNTWPIDVAGVQFSANEAGMPITLQPQMVRLPEAWRRGINRRGGRPNR